MYYQNKGNRKNNLYSIPSQNMSTQMNPWALVNLVLEKYCPYSGVFLCCLFTNLCRTQLYLKVFGAMKLHHECSFHLV